MVGALDQGDVVWSSLSSNLYLSPITMDLFLLALDLPLALLSILYFLQGQPELDSETMSEDTEISGSIVVCHAPGYPSHPRHGGKESTFIRVQKTRSHSSPCGKESANTAIFHF